MIGTRIGRRSSALDVLGWLPLTPLEALGLGFVAMAALVGLLVGVPVGRFLWLAVAFSSALAIVAVAVIRIGRLDPLLGRWLAGVSLTFAVYGALPSWLDGLTDGRTVDRQLAWIESALLGTPLVYRIEPYVSDLWTLVFGLVYSIHVPLFFIPALLHWRAGRPARSERLLLTLAIAMYLGFVGYALFPAYGPVGAADGLRPLGENLATMAVAEYGVALGTFPSLHAGVSFAVALDGWRTSRRWGLAFTGVAALIWASTIYLRYHWVPDLVAGALLALLAERLAALLQARWPRGDADPL